MIRYAVKRARELSEEYNRYCRDKTATRRCEIEFLWCSQCFEAPTIRVLTLNRDIGDTYLSAFVAKDGAYDILIRPDMEPGLRRVVVCKEMFHIVFDDEDVRNMELFNHVLAVVTDVGEQEPEPSVVVEFAAYAAGMEFLFPHAERKNHAALGTAFLKLADMYDLPVDIVDIFMSEKMLEIADPDLEEDA